RCSRAVAVFEAEHRRLREGAVVYLERPLRTGNVRERRVLPAVVHVVQHRMSMRERSTLGILAAHAHRGSLRDQRRKRQRLRVTPVHTLLTQQRLTTTLELPREPRMRGKVAWPGEQLLIERHERLATNPRVNLPELRRTGELPGSLGRCRR